MRAQFTIGAFAIIFNDEQKVLLCHRRDYDLWNLPGGQVEVGESPWDAVLREAKEETGLEVEISRLAGIYFKPKENEIVFSFLCAVLSGQLVLNDEADKIEYFSIDKLPPNTPPKQVERMKDVRQDQLVYKIQTGKSSIELLKEGKL